MDERILKFMNELKTQLQGIPEKEVKDAVGFYEEYLDEALDAGKDLGDVIRQLGSPGEIAGMLRTETSIAKVERSPGLKNFSNAKRAAAGVVTKPLAVFLLSVIEIVTFGIVIALFCGAAAVFLAALASIGVLIYEALGIPSRFAMEIAGTVGTALLLAGICLLTAYLLYKGGIVFIRLSTRFVRMMLKNSAKSLPGPAKGTTAVKSRFKRIILACTVSIIAGAVLFGISGLPQRYFTIFNSMKPTESIKKVVSEYDVTGIARISAATAHSAIRVAPGSSDRIVVTYEEPDWLTHEIDNINGVLTFQEKSNGRLPLFTLVSMHESLTELTIQLPGGFKPENISLESRGGHIFISGLTGSINAKTLNGNIDYSPGEASSRSNVRAKTLNGKIIVGSAEVYEKAHEGVEYMRNENTGKTVELTSTNGNITIDRQK